jgi:hypothetical protein
MLRDDEFYLMAWTSVKQVTRRAELCFMLASCLAYSSTQKLELICSSEMSVNVPRATRRYIPEDMILHNNRCENLQSYTVFFLMLRTSVLSLLKYTFICHVEAQLCNNLQSCSTDSRSMIHSISTASLNLSPTKITSSGRSGMHILKSNKLNVRYVGPCLAKERFI